MIMPSFNRSIHVARHLISDDSKVFIIAEAGVNHNGDMGLAKKLIDVAVDAQADAVKFQTFRAEHLILRNVVKAPYQTKTTDSSESQFDMLKRLEVSHEQNRELMGYCQKKNIIFLTTPFDEQSLSELDGLALPAYKVASTDLTNLPFLEKIARKERPIFLSCGMSYQAEVELALRAIWPFNRDVILLQCTANYPIKDAEANLAVIRTFQDRFDMLIGYSDHSVGVGAAPYAVPMGAKVIEKHFTIDKNMAGPDHKASLDTEELIQFVRQIRLVETYLGNGIKTPTLSESKTRSSLQKALVAARTIRQGETFSEKNMTAKRTGGAGISPIFIQQVIGKSAPRTLERDEVIEVDG